MIRQPANHRGAIIFLLTFSLASTVGAVGRADELARQIQAAEQLAQQAQQALSQKDFDRAAAGFEQALRRWQSLLDKADDTASIQRHIERCQSQLVYALDAPLYEKLRQAEQQASQGHLEEATSQFLQLIEAYDRAKQRIDSHRLENNRMHCANMAGLAAIRFADIARKKQNFSAAADAYRLALRRYEQVHKLLGEHRFANNVKYVQRWLPQVEFEARLAQHAPLPDFELPGVDGPSVRLSHFRGKTVLLVVWAAWCGHCRADLPVLNKFHVENASQGVQVVGLCVDRAGAWNRGKADEAEHLVRNTLCFPNAWADDGVLGSLGSPNAVPAAFWLDAQGRLLGRASLEDLTLESLAQQLNQLVPSSTHPNTTAAR